MDEIARNDEHAELVKRLSSTKGALVRMHARLEAERARNRGLESALELQRAQLEAIRRSRSWKITTPLRLFKRRHLTDYPS